VLDKAVSAVKLILQKGALAAQNATNQKPKPPRPPKPKPEPKVDAPSSGEAKPADPVAKPSDPPEGAA